MNVTDDLPVLPNYIEQELRITKGILVFSQKYNKITIFFIFF